MAEIVVTYPEEGAHIRLDVVVAAGKYQFPERIRGALNSVNNSGSYTGELRVMPLKTWALFFGPIEVFGTYVLHIYDALNPEIHVNLKVRVTRAARLPMRGIVFPPSGPNSFLMDRTVVVVGFTGAPRVTDVRIMHAGEADRTPTQPMPIFPVGRSWSATISIPSSYPCPGDYTVHAEDSLGVPHCDNTDIQLDASLCPEMLRMMKKSANGQMKKSKVKKKKAKAKKK
jgi:hypothetical protein